MSSFMQIQPCENASYGLQLLIALGVIINTAFAAWLAHRRSMADKRDRGTQDRRSFGVGEFAQYRRCPDCKDNDDDTIP